MTTPTREALEHVNTDAISEEEASMLIDMEAIADATGDWADHLPFEAALRYHESEEISRRWSAHVDECDYCARLIDSIKPRTQLIEDFEEVLRETLKGASADQNADLPATQTPAVPSRANWSTAASIVAFALGALLMNGAQRLQPDPNAALISALVKNPNKLSALELSERPIDQFQAASIYLATEHPYAAYDRIGRGLALANVDDSIVREIATAPALSEKPTLLLPVAATKLNDNISNPLMNARWHAQLGQHDEAIEWIALYLREQGVDGAVANDLVSGVRVKYVIENARVERQD